MQIYQFLISFCVELIFNAVVNKKLIYLLEHRITFFQEFG
jgi:hypothetical protein